jgi:hypothetical protein
LVIHTTHCLSDLPFSLFKSASVPCVLNSSLKVPLPEPPIRVTLVVLVLQSNRQPTTSSCVNLMIDYVEHLFASGIPLLVFAYRLVKRMRVLNVLDSN